MPIRGQYKDDKYKDAVERNLRGASSRKGKYKGLKLETAKMYLGIRASDSNHDTKVKELIGEPKVKELISDD